MTANVSGATIKISDVTSGSSVVLDTIAEGNIFTTKTKFAPGKYEVEVSKAGYDTYKTTVDLKGDLTINAVLVESVKTGASAVIANSLVDFENTVLVNDNAIVTVTVKDKDGNVVPGKNVVFSADTETGYSTNPVEVKGQNVQVTDANGQATFVVGLEQTTTDSTNSAKISTAKFSAKVLGVTDGTEDTVTGSVRFAALDLSNVKVADYAKNTDPNYGKLESGENAKNVGYSAAGSGIAGTYSLNKNAGPKDVYYMSTQKVSSEGKNEHEVTFKAKPQIVLPSMTKENNKSDEFVQPVNEKSGDYFTYADYSKIIPLKENASELSYATLMFKDIKVSKYTKLVIESYEDAECSASKIIKSATKTIKGEHSQKEFGYQLPLNNNVRAVKVTLKSAGQVQTDMNSGFDIDKIVGVYKSSSTIQGTTVAIPSSTISWENVDPTMSEWNELNKDKATNENGLGITPKASDDKFMYQVPVFPYTGDAVIKELDKNDKIVAYYLAKTVKSTDDSNKTKNTNILVDTEKAYEATAEEASNHKVGTFTADKDGDNLKVNSTKVGATNLKGTITLPSLGSNKIDASNKYVYTSVQWNPIPKDAAVNTSDAFLALAGQNITVYAQLTDKNGNPVSLQGQTIDYSLNNTTDGAKKSFSSGDSISTLNGTAVVKNTSTDVNGRATLTLNSAQATVIDDLKASSANYDVVLYIGDGKASIADLYWVDANLSFLKDVDGTAPVVTDNDTAEVETDKPTAATPWQYAVKTVGNTFVTTGAGVKLSPSQKNVQDAGTLKDYEISIEGLKINTTFDEDNKGTYKVVGNGVVDASSEREYKDIIINEINGTSVSGDVTFKAKKGDVVKTYKCVGEGTANLNAKMKLNVSWESKGAALAITAPAGTTISRNEAGTTGLEGEGSGIYYGHTDLYVKVTDATGKNPKAGAEVKFKSSVDTDKFSNGAGVSATPVNTVTTDGNGIAHVVLNTASAKQPSSVITASVDGVDQVATTTINWVDYAHEFGLVNADVSSENAKQIVLTFNDNIEANSVKTDMFKVEGQGATNNKVYEVTDAKASGKYVTLTLKSTLPADEYEVSISSTKVDGIEYTLANDKGVKIKNNKVKFYSEKTGKFSTTLNTDNDGVATITIDGIKTALDDATDTEGAAQTAFTKRFVVTVDGKIMTAKYTGTVDDLNDNEVLVTAVGATSGKKISDITYKIQLKQDNADLSNSADKKVAIYYLGGSETKTVKKVSYNENAVNKTIDALKADSTGVNGTGKFDDSTVSITKSDITSIGSSANDTTTVLNVDESNGVLDGTTDSAKIAINATEANKDKTAKVTLTVSKGSGDNKKSKNVIITVKVTGDGTYSITVE